MGTPGSTTTKLRVALTLAGLAAVLTLALAGLAHVTEDRIARNRQAWLMQRLDALIAPELHDNDLFEDRVRLSAPDLLGTDVPAEVFRVRKSGQPMGVAIRSVVPDGYRGPIELLTAIRYDGSLIGVQVLHHNETPGLGDAFETRDRQWLERFAGLSLSNPPQQRWTVRKEGGDFDAFTGATTTPRAIVKGIRRALELYAAQRDRLFTLPSGSSDE
jgi:Na+-translocating ferredoxin:NAD+ oxidoreductase subunit G